MSVEDAFATAQLASNEAKEQLASLQKKRDAPKSGLLADFNKHISTGMKGRGRLCIGKLKRWEIFLTRSVRRSLKRLRKL